MAGLELKEADLSSNNFSEMPEAILVSTLQNLSITDNVMTKLPPTITRLQSLKTCNLEGNQLESTPQRHYIDLYHYISYIHIYIYQHNSNICMYICI
jgi:Leucine-rich repeat (LRR) protein